MRARSFDPSGSFTIALTAPADRPIRSLMRAVDKFDPARGFRLSTYATPWIHQAIDRAIWSKGRGIKVPGVEVDRLRRARRDGQGDGEPTEADLARTTNLSPERVRELLAWEADPCFSLHAAADGDPGLAIAAAADRENATERVERALDTDLAAQRLREALSQLPERERIVLERRYGLEGEGAETRQLAAIGKALGVSARTVSEIQERGGEATGYPTVRALLGRLARTRLISPAARRSAGPSSTRKQTYPSG